MTDKTRNRKTALVAASAAASMAGLSFAAVPAYRAFCQITGWGGTTGRSAEAPTGALDRAITVRFDATTAQGLPWRFKPEQTSQTLKIGETALAFYRAENLSDAPVTGRATFNVQPAKAGIYFKKIECFCFTEQVLGAHENASMPVSYYIDPALADDPKLDDVQTITLAYTFFPWDDESAAAPVAAAVPSAAATPTATDSDGR
jgi:cytochrome c oxidase assembly protein subunit 11